MGIAALEHREGVAAFGHVVASLQRGYVSADMASGSVGVAERLPVPRGSESVSATLSADDQCGRWLRTWASSDSEVKGFWRYFSTVAEPPLPCNAVVGS